MRAAEPSEQDFHDLNPDADDLAVVSSMVTDDALEEFARFEEAKRTDEDAVFQRNVPTVDSFISFVWAFIAVEEERSIDPADLDIATIVDSTLGAVQSSIGRGRLVSIAETVRSAYLRSDSQARLRWRRTGTSVGTARRLDDLARHLAGQLVDRLQDGTLGDLDDPRYVVRLLAQIIRRLLNLPESPTWQFRVSKRGAGIDVAVGDVLAQWLDGTPLPEMADRLLAALPDPSWRIEEMVDAVTTHFEHYLSWTVGALTEFTNMHLTELDSELRLCPDLGTYLRYGVGEPDALVLMRSGIRSRRLANEISKHLPVEIELTAESIGTWLGMQSVSDWRVLYSATPSELLDLLDFTRRRRRSLLRELLEYGRVAIELSEATTTAHADLTLEPKRGEPAPAPICVYSGDQELATVQASDHADIDAILGTGLELDLAISL